MWRMRIGSDSLLTGKYRLYTLRDMPLATWFFGRLKRVGWWLEIWWLGKEPSSSTLPRGTWGSTWLS